MQHGRLGRYQRRQGWSVPQKGSETEREGTTMKRIFLALLFLLLLHIGAQAQITISGLPAASAMTDDDLLVLVDNPGSPSKTTKNITFLNFMASAKRLGLNATMPTVAGVINTQLGANAVVGLTIKRFTDTS